MTVYVAVIDLGGDFASTNNDPGDQVGYELCQVLQYADEPQQIFLVSERVYLQNCSDFFSFICQNP